MHQAFFCDWKRERDWLKIRCKICWCNCTWSWETAVVLTCNCVVVLRVVALVEQCHCIEHDPFCLSLWHSNSELHHNKKLIQKCWHSSNLGVPSGLLCRHQTWFLSVGSLLHHTLMPYDLLLPSMNFLANHVCCKGVLFCPITLVCLILFCCYTMFCCIIVCFNVNISRDIKERRCMHEL